MHNRPANFPSESNRHFLRAINYPLPVAPSPDPPPLVDKYDELVDLLFYHSSDQTNTRIKD